MYTCLCNGYCWIAPGSGTVLAELWGAGGSGSKMCCCGGGLPGNAGSYANKAFNVTSGNYTCGCLGKSCGNADGLCNRGCSSNSAMCWLSSSTKVVCVRKAAEAELLFAQQHHHCIVAYVLTDIAQQTWSKLWIGLYVRWRTHCVCVWRRC